MTNPIPNMQDRAAPQPIFKSAHQALTFAHSFSGAAAERPAMNRMADRAGRAGRGLSGLDGAGQAAMILRMLGDLDRVHRAVLMCMYVPRETTCGCCGGAVPAAEWLGAVRLVSDAIQSSEAFSGHLVHRVVRDQLVGRFFGQKVHLQQLAARANISPNTVTAHNSRVMIALRGARTLKGKDGARAPGVKGLVDHAMAAAEAVLLAARIIGETDNP
jgi:hypothetical protein